MIHYIKGHNDLESTISPKSQIPYITPCTGCCLHTPHPLAKRHRCIVWISRNDVCKVKTIKKSLLSSKHKAISQLYQKNLQPVFVTKPLHLIKLECYNNFLITSKSYLNQHVQDVMPPEDHISKIWSLDRELHEKLTNLQGLLSALTSLSFYTDGSVRDLLLPTCRMGIGWTLDHTTIKADFSASAAINPSSSKAEALAILSVLTVCPANSKVTIYTDSQTCIFNYQKMLTQYRYRKLLKIKNHDIWKSIMKVMEIRYISLTLLKVKAHSNNLLNDRADQLSKEGSQSTYLLELNEI
jgi:ribonuclease HI